MSDDRSGWEGSPTAIMERDGVGEGGGRTGYRVDTTAGEIVDEGEVVASLVSPAVRLMVDQGDLLCADCIHCECGEITGTRCAWRGPRRNTMCLEYMPVYLRASHQSARNAGVWPQNGSIRIRAEITCADRLIEDDAEWCSEVTQ